MIRDGVPREVRQSVSERRFAVDLLMDGKPETVVKGRRRMCDVGLRRGTQ